MERERLEDLLARLGREREEADRHYNDALTGVDHAQLRMPEFPHAPPPYDETQVTPLNLNWDILPDGPPEADRTLKGRLRGLVWRLVGPPLTTQRAFNAALVDHLNRNTATHREAARAITTTIALVEGQVAAVAHFQSALIRFVQGITLYVDTKDRTVGGQVQVLNASLSALTDDWLKHWESLLAREQRFEARHPALLRAYDELKEKVTLAQQTTLMLKREVEHLITEGLHVETPGAATAVGSSTASVGTVASGTPDLDSFKYVGFEDRFRGSQEQIRAQLVDYLPIFEGARNVLDVGCGRGELLDLFHQQGIGARGIDVNHSMVAICRERGLTADHDDALGYLLRLPDESLDGLIAIQVVEHLEPAYLSRFIEAAFYKLQPGAPMVLETINPACWVAFFESYIRDVTHRWPLHPDTLQYFIQASGFSTVTVQFRAPVAEADKLQRVPLLPPREGRDHDPTLVDLVDIVNSHTDKLNARMFTYLDYAAICRK